MSRSHSHVLILGSVLFAVCYLVWVVKLSWSTLRGHLNLPLIFIPDQRKALLLFWECPFIALDDSHISCTVLGKDPWSYDESRDISSQPSQLPPFTLWMGTTTLKIALSSCSTRKSPWSHMLLSNASSDFCYVFVKCQTYEEPVILLFFIPAF